MITGNCEHTWAKCGSYDRVKLLFRLADIPHVFKRWRSRIINRQSLFLRYEDETSSHRPMKVVNVERLRQINPEIPATAFRSSSLPAMDDAYPRMLFTQETLDCRVRRMEFSFLGWSMCFCSCSYVECLSASALKFKRPLLTNELLVDSNNAFFSHIRDSHNGETFNFNL